MQTATKQQWHIGRNGEPGRCSASKESCPFGGVSEHFDNIQDARKEAEHRFAKEAGGSFDQPALQPKDPKKANKRVEDEFSDAHKSEDAMYIASIARDAEISENHFKSTLDDLDYYLENYDKIKTLPKEDRQNFRSLLFEAQRYEGSSNYEVLQSYRKKLAENSAKRRFQAALLRKRLGVEKQNDPELDILNEDEQRLLQQAQSQQVNTATSPGYRTAVPAAWKNPVSPLSKRDNDKVRFGIGTKVVAPTDEPPTPNAQPISYSDIEKSIDSSHQNSQMKRHLPPTPQFPGNTKVTVSPNNWDAQQAVQTRESITAKLHKPRYIVAEYQSKYSKHPVIEDSLLQTANYNEALQRKNTPLYNSSKQERAAVLIQEQTAIQEYKRLHGKKSFPPTLTGSIRESIQKMGDRALRRARRAKKSKASR